MPRYHIGPTIAPLLAAVIILGADRRAWAQVTAATDGRIIYSHHHLYVTNVADHKKFWIETLGGSLAPIESRNWEAVQLSNIYMLLAPRDSPVRPVRPVPMSDTRATPVSHIAFKVPDLRAMLTRVRAAGYPVVTEKELPDGRDVKDGVGFDPAEKASVAFVMAPDDIKVELVEHKAMKVPIALHHIHFAAPGVDEMQAWYAKAFALKLGTTGSIKAAGLPGVDLTFSPASGPVVATRGRTVDHIGFEVKDLAGFCKDLEASGIKLDRPFRAPPNGVGLAVAFVTDPWGTTIELTEGLAPR